MSGFLEDRYNPGATIEAFFHTFDSNDPSASTTVTTLAVGDIKIYKDGGGTERASTSGYTVDDDFDTLTGIHRVSIDLSDNTTANFYEAGSSYAVVIDSITVDAGTVRFVLGTFKIGYDGAALDTTIATLASQTSFTLEDGSADNDAYNDWMVIQHDLASDVQLQVGYVSDYVGSTKTVTLYFDPSVFTAAAGDNISLFPPHAANVQLWRAAQVTTPFVAGVPNTNVDYISRDATAADNAELFFDGTGYNAANSTIGTVSSVDELAASALADMFNTDSGTTYGAAVAGSVVKEVADNAGGSSLTEAGIADAVWDEATSGHTTAGTFGAQCATDIDAILVDTNSLNDTKVPDTISLANINAQVDTALTDIHLDHLLAADYDPASKPGTATALLNELVENDGGVSRFTTNALEQAPTGGSAPTAAAIADAVWDEATSGHTTSGTFGEQLATDVDAILVDTNSLNDTKIPDTISLANINAQADTALTDYDPPTKTEMDALLTTALTESYASDGATVSVAQALYEILQSLTEFAISGTTISVKQRDGSTEALTYTLDDATNPTSRTRAT